MVTTPVGRARKVAAYRAGDHVKRRILLAGDHLGFPSVDGAEESGLWAAQIIVDNAAESANVAARL
jgi:hypothetical protein